MSYLKSFLRFYSSVFKAIFGEEEVHETRSLLLQEEEPKVREPFLRLRSSSFLFSIVQFLSSLHVVPISSTRFFSPSSLLTSSSFQLLTKELGRERETKQEVKEIWKRRKKPSTCDLLFQAKHPSQRLENRSF